MRAQAAPWIIGLLLCLVAGLLVYARLHFDWGLFWQQLRHIDAYRVCLATAAIYVTVCLRALRWSLLLKPRTRTVPVELIGAQFIGFTCVALFGSLADLVRPYLLARKVGLPVSSLIATYTIERMFDLGSAALIFSGALAFAGQGSAVLQRQTFVHIGVASLSATVAILLMAIAVRALGGELAAWTERTLSQWMPRVGTFAADKLRSFSEGLRVVTSIGDFLKILAVSLCIWGLVATAFVQVVHAFVRTPQLTTLDFSQTMLLMAASIGGSLVQLPVIGWFTQIAAMAAIMHAILAVPTEAATACGALLLAVTFLFLIPGGLVFAHFMRLSLRTVIQASDAVTAPAD